MKKWNHKKCSIKLPPKGSESERRNEKNSVKKKNLLLKDSTALLCYVVLTRHKSYLQIVVYILLSFSFCLPRCLLCASFLLSSRLQSILLHGILLWPWPQPNHIQFQYFSSPFHLSICFNEASLSAVVWRNRPLNRLTNKHPERKWTEKFPRSSRRRWSSRC